MQTDGLGASQVDGLAMTVRGATLARAELGSPILAGPGRGVEVALTLFETCPESAPSLRVEGTVVFSRLGFSEGDRVAGRFDWLRVSDARTGESLGVLEGADSRRFVR